MKKEEVLAMLQAFARAKGPEVAPIMLELLIESITETLVTTFHELRAGKTPTAGRSNRSRRP